MTVTVDYDRMLALLASDQKDGAHLLVTGPDGGVTVWQSAHTADRERVREVTEAFAAAARAAGERGYRVDRWVLCLPDGLAADALAAWQRWRAEQQDGTGVVVELWDRSTTRRQLTRPDADQDRPWAGPPCRDRQPPADARLRIPVNPTPGESRAWARGVTVAVGEQVYLLRDPVEERTAPDRSWAWRDATAEEADPPHRPVRLRQVEIRRLTRTGAQLRDGLGTQADVLSIVDPRSGLPRLVGRHDEGGRTTLITSLPAGPAWREAYGPGPAALDRLTAAAALAAVVPVCAALSELHRSGHAHRALGPDAIVLLDRHRRGALRDAGLAGFGALPAEGVAPYRAHEQVRRSGAPGARPGPRTDVYQLAALVYHTLTGTAPGPAPNPPIRATLPLFPVAADEVVTRALHPDPAARLRSVDRLASALRDACGDLSRGTTG